MYFHQVPRDSKPEPEPAMLASRGAVGLSKSIEDVRHKLLVNTLPRIRNTDLNCATSLRHLDAYTPATLRKLHRIR